MSTERPGLSASDRLSAAALVIVDMQNDFVREGAPLEVPDARKTIPAHQRLGHSDHRHFLLR